MNMRKNIIDIYNSIVNNEDILRLLIYNPSNALDNPLDKTKPNILDIPVGERFKTIDKHILRTPKTTDIDNTTNISRLCMYPAKRIPTRNYEVADQDIIFDLYVHHSIDHIDLRLAWLCDYINNFISGSRITGIGSIRFFDGNVIFNSPEGYTGYRLIYRFGSNKK